MDTNSDGTIDLQEWTAYLQGIHDKKGKEKGDKYLNRCCAVFRCVRRREAPYLPLLTGRIFATLEFNVKELIADRAEWLGLEDEVSEVFTKVSLLDGDPNTMDKACLVAAQRGDFQLFEKIDTNEDGQITVDEWHEYLEKLHKSKGDKGTKHIKRILHTMLVNLADMEVDKQKKEAAEAEAAAKALEAKADAENDPEKKATLLAQAQEARDAVDVEKQQLLAAAKAAEEEAAEAKEAEWRTLKAEAEEVFFKISALDGDESGYDLMTKECLVQAQKGDFKADLCRHLPHHSRIPDPHLNPPVV